MNSYLGLADYYTVINLITHYHPLYYLQTMAIGTLSACYNNPWVFTGVVKIRKVQAVEMIMGSTNTKQILSPTDIFSEPETDFSEKEIQL